MTKTAPSIPARIGVALFIEFGLFVFGLDRMAKFSTWEEQVKADFWIAAPSAICIVALWPVLRRGHGWQRVAAVLLSLFPALTFCATVAEQFSVTLDWFR